MSYLPFFSKIWKRPSPEAEAEQLFLCRLESRLEFGTQRLEGALVISQPVRVPTDAPVVLFNLNNRDPYSVRTIRSKGLGFGQQGDLGEIKNHVTLGQSVKPTGG